MNDRRTFLKSIGALAIAPAVPAAAVCDYPEKKREWPKSLPCIDRTNGITWQVCFKRELNISSRKPLHRGKLRTDHVFIQHDFLGPGSSVFLFKEGAVVSEPSDLIDFDNAVSQYYSGQYADQNLPFVPAIHGNEPPMYPSGIFLTPASSLWIKAKQDIVIPEDMDVIVRCQIAEYTTLDGSLIFSETI